MSKNLIPSSPKIRLLEKIDYAVLSLLTSLLIVIVFAVSWSLKVVDFHYTYLGLSPTHQSSAGELAKNGEILGSIDLGNLTFHASTLSAIPSRIGIWIAFGTGALLIALVLAIVQLAKGKPVKNTLFGFFYSAALSSLSIFAIDDLSDEAYLWAEKVRELVSTGVPGVRLWDDTLAESTVGTLQFVLSAIVLLLTPVTIEVALLLPVLLSVFLCVWLMHVTFLRAGLKVGSLVAPALVVATPSLILNSSQAFDNVIGFSLVCSWVSVALWTNLRGNTFLWFTVVASILAPIVRLELVVFSVLSMVVAIHYYFSNLRSSKAAPAYALSTWLRPTLAIGVSVLGTGVFMVWRLVSFGSLFPAMISYKSFNGDIWALWMGVWTTLFAPWAFTSSVAANILVGFVFLAGLSLAVLCLWRKELTANLPKTSLVLVPLLALSATSAIGAGGDYFPASYLRYLITPTLTLFFVVLFFLFREMKDWRITKLPVAKFGAMCALVLPLYSNSHLVLQDIASVEPGRTTCDAMAVKALEGLGEFEQDMPVVATTEINGVSFHSRARLFDLIGLVDPRWYPQESRYPAGAASLPDLYKFNHYEKYSLTPTEGQIRSIDYLWIWGSTVCRALENYELSVRPAQINDELQSRVSSILNEPVTEFRIGSLDRYVRNGFRPVKASFWFTFEGQSYVGTTFVLRQN